MIHVRTFATTVTILLLASACARKAPPSEPQPAGVDASSKPLTAAVVGKPAPDFELSDLDGKRVKLSSFRGKTVVLEWFNPGCPFVRASHTKGSLAGTAERHRARGVVWLAVNSGAPGKQGHGMAANREGAAQFGLKHPILLDESGDIGRAYGAERTPHLYVIDSTGTLVYRGAIDNSPDAEGESPSGGKLVNYVDQALSELEQGRAVSVPGNRSLWLYGEVSGLINGRVGDSLGQNGAGGHGYAGRPRCIRDNPYG